MKKIYCFPFESVNNKYIEIQKNIWSSSGFHVDSLFLLVSDIITFHAWPRREDICILNWFEDIPSNSTNSALAFLKCIFVLLFVRVFFLEIIWVKHNLKPHSGRCFFYFDILSYLLGVISTKVVAHRPISDAVFYIPHPLYDIPDINKNMDIPCLIFGAVKGYKCIPELLEIWPDSVSLIIAGFCNDDMLRQEIIDIINKRNISVTWVDEYLSDFALNELILRSKMVVFNHSDNSMIVSGSFYHAASCGSNILIRSGEFGSFCEKNYSFAKQYNDADSLALVLSDTGFTRNEIINEAEEKNGYFIVAKCWASLLDRS